MAYEIEGATRRDVDLGDVTLSAHHAGPEDGPAVVLCHGFPELAYSWRHQIRPLADAGYHVIAADGRGYGDSSVPPAITDYGAPELTGDVVGLLNAFGYEQGILIGHDWGSAIVSHTTVLHPDVVRGIANVSLPFLLRAPETTTEFLSQNTSHDEHYIVFFQEPGRAERELDTDVRGAFERMMHAGVDLQELEAATGGYAAHFYKSAMVGPGLGDEIWSDKELDLYVEAFERTGFGPPLNYYRNLDRTWEETEDVDHSVRVPALMLHGGWDPFIPPGSAELVKEHIPGVEAHVIEHAGHWIMEEYPEETNKILLGWLTRNFPADA